MPRERRGAYVVLEGGALKVFHGDERLSAIFADVVNRADVGMIERGGCLSFALKTGECLRITGNLFRQKL
jgi:hypothetical protein